MLVELEPEFPEHLAPLFESAPYKVIEGGRGKGASWGFARAMLLLGLRRKLFCVCAREIQKSIEESAKKLLEEQIEMLGLHEHVDEQGRHLPARYEVFDDEIRGSNGTRIVFVGVRTHVRKIKSMEGIDIFWAIEATHFSQLSWDIVMPTVRRDAPFGPFGKGSELWIDFNPELATDYTYRAWVGDPPPDAIVIHASWRDNPWFPERMQKEMLRMKDKDYDNYLNIYEGKVRRTLAGAIYAKELTKAIEQGRVAPSWKLDKSKPVEVWCDLGRGDFTSLLFTQQIGLDYVLGDYYGNCGFDWSHYILYLQQSGYIIRRIGLPHDGDNEVIQARDSVKTQTKRAFPGERQVVTVKRPQRKALAINAGRQMFPRIYVNEIACADWMMAAQHYQYGVKLDPQNSEKEKRTPEPLHNWASHPMDAYHTFVLGQRPDMIKDEPDAVIEKVSAFQNGGIGQSWMSA